MDTKLIMDYIAPFSGLYYRSCLFNSLFSVIDSFGLDIMPLLVNDIIRFGTISSKQGHLFGMEYISSKDLKQIIRDMGILITEHDYESDSELIEGITGSIKKNSPVMIWVDVFFASIRKDTFQKMHTPHTWIIYGLDEEERVFHIIEQEELENLRYGKKAVSYEELVQAYKGYMSRYRRVLQLPSLYCFSNQQMVRNIYESHSTEDYKTLFLNHFAHNKAAVYQGLDTLASFLTDMTKTAMTKEALQKKADEYTTIMNQIVNDLKAEKFKWERLNCKSLVETQDGILELWNSVRRDIVKFTLTEKYNAEKFAKLKDWMAKMLELQQHYYEQVYSE